MIPFDAERSLLLGRTTRMAGGPHPRELGSDGFSEDEVGLIRDWIDESARSPPGTYIVTAWHPYLGA